MVALTLTLITIGQDGIPRDLQIQKGLGYGLDERAIECVTGWRFSPGVYEGKRVPVAAMVSVGFSLSGRFGTQLLKALCHWTPNKTICVKDTDLTLLELAQEQLGDSVSSMFAELLPEASSKTDS